MPRLLSGTAHATRPNEIIHFDYLYMGKSRDQDKNFINILVIKNDLSSCCWLKRPAAVDSNHVAKILARRTRVFTAPKVWVSDQGTHFKSEVVANLARTFHVNHHAVAYFY